MSVKKIAVLLPLCLLVAFFSQCRKQPAKREQASPYLNQHDSVAYVGMETCRTCHADKFNTYIHTGMGLSFDIANREKSAAQFGPHVQVFDSVLNLYYHPYFKGDTLFIKEYRLDGKDTIHRHTVAVDFIIGSGQHTNSHLLWMHGYLYQAPITYYTQKGTWDLAPGMSGGFNSRFSRMIESECITCHNALPEQVTGSVNKYTAIPTGIDCERCHGPGELHVAKIRRGELTDTATAFDYTIVNPRGLSVDLQNDLCFRCHLQGVNVLMPGAVYTDFKPGDAIKEHWNVFLPRFDGKNDQFLMASQADRMVQSKCFIESGKLSCITCHNPHLTVKETPVAQFNQPCLNCHTQANQTTCSESIAARQLQNDHCSGCHIPKSGSIDIPHVSISDHKIQIPGKEKEKSDGQFLGLEAITDPQVAPIHRARAYLRYYEGFVSDPLMLDSASYWLSKSEKNRLYTETEIHLLYVKKEYKKATIKAAELELADIDPWTAYRVGESWFLQGDYQAALPYFERAVATLPYQLDFQLKYGSALYLSGQVEQGARIFTFITGENPSYEKAWFNLGVYYSAKGKYSDAETALRKAIALNPDYLQARVGLAELLLKTRQKNAANEVIRYLQKYHSNEPAVVDLGRRLRTL